MNSAPDALQIKTAVTHTPSTTTPQADTCYRDRVKTIFEKKYEHYRLLAFRYVRSKDDAKDIVANVFERALLNWPAERYESILNLEAYMCRAIINDAINTAKRKKRIINLNDLPIDTFLVTNPMVNFDLDIDALIKLLPNKQKDAFGLFLQGYSHEEIAQRLNLNSEGASKNLIYYARKKLQKIMNDLPEYDPDDRGPGNSNRSEAKRVFKRNKIALTSGPGFTPKVKDLLHFLLGNNLKESNRRSIVKWLIYQDYAFEIISGLKLALQNQTAKSIETEIQKDKNSLRERLFGSTEWKQNPDEQSLFTDYPITPCFYPNKLKSDINSNRSIKETGECLYEKFQDHIQAGFDQYCLKKELPKTDDQFVHYLIDLELISLAPLQQYTLVSRPDRSSKTSIADNFSDYSESFVWNLLSIKRGKKL